MPVEGSVLKSPPLLPPGRIDTAGAQANYWLERCKLCIYCWKKRGRVWGLRVFPSWYSDAWNRQFIIYAVENPVTLSVYRYETRFSLCWFRSWQNAPDLRPRHLLTILGCLPIACSPTIPYSNYSSPSTHTWNATSSTKIQSISLCWTLKKHVVYLL